MIRTLLLASMVALAAAPAHAQAYPDRPVKLVAPIPPGGAGDMVARLLANAASQELGQQVIVDNRPGATGNIGTTLVARSPADGYTLLFCSIGNCAVNASLYANPGYKLLEDFRPVMLIGSSINVLTAGPDTGIDSLQTLITRAKAGNISYASSGVGASNHLGGELLKVSAGIPMLHVPYKGSGPAINDLLGGQVDVFFDNEPSILPFVRTGKVKALAVTGKTRSANLPDVPTLVELGYADFVIEPWYAIAVPKDTPDDVVARLSSALQAALAQEKVQQTLRAAGITPAGGTPEQLDTLIRSEVTRWAQLIKQQNIQGN
ncbi:Tricarboxylate transport protein TctC [plant metagenome]|uniref:Tricarboxylate transport protein TctC n=1 Tax=plant metagenome TaxID=1297885 RepID=A0A484QSZ6_9ZZZZ